MECSAIDRPWEFGSGLGIGVGLWIGLRLVAIIHFGEKWTFVGVFRMGGVLVPCDHGRLWIYGTDFWVFSPAHFVLPF